MKGITYAPKRAPSSPALGSSETSGRRGHGSSLKGQGTWPPDRGLSLNPISPEVRSRTLFFVSPWKPIENTSRSQVIINSRRSIGSRLPSVVMWSVPGKVGPGQRNPINVRFLKECTWDKSPLGLQALYPVRRPCRTRRMKHE